MVPYRFSLPGTWEALDLDRRTDLAGLTALLSRRLDARVPQVDRRRLLTSLHRAVRSAAGAGAVQGAIFAEAVEEEVVGASLFVSAVASFDVLGEHGVDLDALAGGLSPVLAGVSEGGEVEVERVDLPAGPAVRARYRTSAEAMGRRLVSREVQYHVPTPDQASLLIFQFATPTLPLEAAFEDLFAAIVESLEWEAPAPPDGDGRLAP